LKCFSKLAKLDALGSEVRSAANRNILQALDLVNRVDKPYRDAISFFSAAKAETSHRNTSAHPTITETYMVNLCMSLGVSAAVKDTIISVRKDGALVYQNSQ
jgi:hypothetical protein